MVKVIKTNQNGWQLKNNGMFWSISKPNGDGTNNVANVGKEKYIKKIWENLYAKR